jgi:hypothetical protein
MLIYITIALQQRASVAFTHNCWKGFDEDYKAFELSIMSCESVKVFWSSRAILVISEIESLIEFYPTVVSIVYGIVQSERKERRVKRNNCSELFQKHTNSFTDM